MLVGSKGHFKKFLKKVDERDGGRPRAENLDPGTVIEDKITRADIPEFFMQPHKPNQAKFLRKWEF